MLLRVILETKEERNERVENVKCLVARSRQSRRTDYYGYSLAPEFPTPLHAKLVVRVMRSTLFAAQFVYPSPLPPSHFLPPTTPKVSMLLGLNTAPYSYLNAELVLCCFRFGLSLLIPPSLCRTSILSGDFCLEGRPSSSASREFKSEDWLETDEFRDAADAFEPRRVFRCFLRSASLGTSIEFHWHSSVLADFRGSRAGDSSCLCLFACRSAFAGSGVVVSLPVATPFT